MADLSLTGYVTRAELGLANLALNTSTYRVIENSWGPGEVTWRRQVTKSPFIHGELATQMIKETGNTPLGIRVIGSNPTDCFNKMNILLRAFDQFQYSLSFNLEGTIWGYICQAADYTVGEGGVIQKFHIKAYQQEVRFSIPRYPIPVSGPA